MALHIEVQRGGPGAQRRAVIVPDNASQEDYRDRLLGRAGEPPHFVELEHPDAGQMYMAFAEIVFIFVTLTNE